MRTLTDADLNACRHPGEKPRFFLALLFVGPVMAGSLLLLLLWWVVLPILLAGDGNFNVLISRIIYLVIIIALILLIAWLVSLAIDVKMRASAAEITPASLPELDTALVTVCNALGYHRDHFSAFLVQNEKYDLEMTTWRRSHLFIYSGLAEAVYEYDAPGELAYFAASAVGELRIREMRMMFIRHSIDFVNKTPLLNLMVLPYLRATVYTGDRVALAATGDLQSALDAMAGRIVGKDLASIVALGSWIEQHGRLRGSFLSFLFRMFSGEPHPVDRLCNILCFAREALPRRYEEVISSLPVAHRKQVEAILAESRHRRRR